MLVVLALKFYIYIISVLKDFWRRLLLYKGNIPIWNICIMHNISCFKFLHLTGEFSLVFYHLLHLNDIILTAFLKVFLLLVERKISSFRHAAFPLQLHCPFSVSLHITKCTHNASLGSWSLYHGAVLSECFIPFGTLRTCEVTPLISQEGHHWFLTGLADEISQ